MSLNVLQELKKAKLTGRGGGCFPTSDKWEMVASAKGKRKYVICNASEGEPGVKKDLFILENYPEPVIQGMKLAQEFLSAERGFLYLNPDYYPRLLDKLKKIIGHYPISVIRKPHSAGYIGGEETSVINALEQKRIEPLKRPPFPSTVGYHGEPTLINNVETFYDVSLISQGKYKKKRFYTINGDCLWTGVYELPENWTIARVLKETKNYPRFAFFVQSGGDGSGLVLNEKQLNRPVSGSASITVYSLIKHQPMDLIKKWVDFFTAESCGQCTPCREGTYRLRELINAKEIDWPMFASILDTLAETSFCGLGNAAPIAVRSYVNNVISTIPKNKIKLPARHKELHL